MRKPSRGRLGSLSTHEGRGPPQAAQAEKERAQEEARRKAEAKATGDERAERERQAREEAKRRIKARKAQAREKENEEQQLLQQQAVRTANPPLTIGKLRKKQNGSLLCLLLLQQGVLLFLRVCPSSPTKIEISMQGDGLLVLLLCLHWHNRSSQVVHDTRTCTEVRSKADEAAAERTRQLALQRLRDKSGREARGTPAAASRARSPPERAHRRRL